MAGLETTSDDDSVRTIRLTNPTRRNSLDLAMTTQLAEAVEGTPPDAGAIVLLAEGDHFCVGGDVPRSARRPIQGSSLVDSPTSSTGWCGRSRQRSRWPSGYAGGRALGLVDHLVADDAVDLEALAIGRRLADGPRSAYLGIKKLVREGAGRGLGEHLDAEVASMAARTASPEGREGITAFVERRPANFRAVRSAGDTDSG